MRLVLYRQQSKLLLLLLSGLITSLLGGEDKQKELTFITSANCPQPSGHKVIREQPYAHMMSDRWHHTIMDWHEKAACTKAVEMFWNGMNITRGVQYPKDAFIHNYKHSFFSNCGIAGKELFNGAEYYKFKVVRNPFNRAVSSYLHVARYHLLKNPDERLQKFLDSKGISAQDYSFEGFLDICLFLFPIVSNIFEVPYTSFISHSSPQCFAEEVKRFHNKKLGPMFNKIVHLENFEEDIALVNKETGMNYSYPLGEDNHVIPKEVQPDVYHGNWTYAEMQKKHGVPENYGKFFSLKTKRMVEVIFSNDLKLYNYSFPYDKVFSMK